MNYQLSIRRIVCLRLHSKYTLWVESHLKFSMIRTRQEHICAPLKLLLWALYAWFGAYFFFCLSSLTRRWWSWNVWHRRKRKDLQNKSWKTLWRVVFILKILLEKNRILSLFKWEAAMSSSGRFHKQIIEYEAITMSVRVVLISAVVLCYCIYLHNFWIRLWNMSLTVSCV